MHSTDRDSFEAVLTQLAVAFPKDITDPLRAVYWEALKDLPIGTVQRMAAQRAKFGKFFPKPAELRPIEEKPPTPLVDDRKFNEGVQRSIRNLEALRAEDAVRWEAEVRARLNARIIATAQLNSIQYAEARRAEPELRRAAGWIGPLRLT